MCTADLVDVPLLRADQHQLLQSVVHIQHMARPVPAAHHSLDQRLLHIRVMIKQNQ